MNEVAVHPAAQAEYEAAAVWYAERSAAAAQRFVFEVEAAIEAIRLALRVMLDRTGLIAFTFSTGFPITWPIGS